MCITYYMLQPMNLQPMNLQPMNLQPMNLIRETLFTFNAEKCRATRYQYIIISLFTIEKLVERMKINDNCVGCGQCASFCKKGAIEVWGRARSTDACVECGICIPYCPVKAIEVPA
jgi:NAD-dependent dihydropyrimidine dehydrogenase PreA subunit